VIVDDQRKSPETINTAVSEARDRRPRVLFLAPGDIGKGRVEPISWMQTCRAYAMRGFDVSLVTLNVRRPDALSAHDVWEHYGFRPCFRITMVPTLLGRNARVSSFRLRAGLTSLVYALGIMTRQALRPTTVVIHTRLPVIAAPFILLRRLLPARRRPRIVFETHSIPRGNHQWVVCGADLVVTNSEKLARDIRGGFRIPADRVRHVPLPPYNAIKPHDKQEARIKVGVPKDALVVCYTGKMTHEHNEFFLRTAAALVDRLRNLRLLLVGGNPEVLDWTRHRATELGVADALLLPGFVPPAKVEWYQAAADVLVYHMPDSMQIFAYCTPAKGYEYQAAERPIVATDIPLFEEVFGADRDRAIRVWTRTPEALADGVLEALALEDGGRAMTQRAATWVKSRTWDRRAGAILEALDL
jgi:glycosyltransferase involved in cell wall biosynthesis